MNLNKTFILGNAVRDPETRALPSGASVASFSVATNRFFKGAQNQKQQEVEFHNIIAFGKLADLASNYIVKGKVVLIEGRIKTDSWQDKKTGEKKYRTQIIAENIQLGAKPTQAESPDISPELKKKLEETTPEKHEPFDDGEIDVKDIPL